MPAAADTIKLVDDTIALNHALLGGGVYVVPGGGVTTVVDTIIATNMASSQVDGYDVIGTFTDEGYNLIGIAGPDLVLVSPPTCWVRTPSSGHWPTTAARHRP